jgi:hypothetical protein
MHDWFGHFISQANLERASLRLSRSYQRPNLPDLPKVDRVRDLQKSTSSHFSSSRPYFFVISAFHNSFYGRQFLQYQPWCQSRPGAV